MRVRAAARARITNCDGSADPGMAFDSIPTKWCLERGHRDSILLILLYFVMFCDSQNNLSFGLLLESFL